MLDEAKKYVGNSAQRQYIGNQDTPPGPTLVREILMPSDRASFETYVCQFLAKVTLYFFMNF